MQISDAMVEAAWAAVVGSDIAGQCTNANIVRGDLKSAISAALAGHVVVPEVPTQEMRQAGEAAYCAAAKDNCATVYRAMISAAPAQRETPPSKDAGDE